MIYKLMHEKLIEKHSSFLLARDSIVDHLSKYESNSYRIYRKVLQYSHYIPDLIVSARLTYLRDNNTMLTFSITIDEDSNELAMPDKLAKTV